MYVDERLRWTGVRRRKVQADLIKNVSRLAAAGRRLYERCRGSNKLLTSTSIRKKFRKKVIPAALLHILFQWPAGAVCKCPSRVNDPRIDEVQLNLEKTWANFVRGA